MSTEFLNQKFYQLKISPEGVAVKITRKYVNETKLTRKYGLYK